jgi:mannan polymerase II complex MNN11 subunit
MHFALPPRKTSHPPPYARNTSSNALVHRRRRQLQIAGYAILALLTLYLVLRHTLLADADHTSTGPAGIDGQQDIVIVTLLDHEVMSKEYVHMVKTNRDHYAARHGRTTCYEPEAPRKTTNRTTQVTRPSIQIHPPISISSTLPLHLGPSSQLCAMR